MSYASPAAHLKGSNDKHRARVALAQAYQPFTRNVARDTRTPAERRAATTMRTNHEETP